MRFTQKELLAVSRGELVVKNLDSSAKQELAFFGIVHVDAPPTHLIDQFRDIETFKKSESVLKIKKLKNPPEIEEFNGMTLEKEDIRGLKKCKPGKCDMKLSTSMIQRFQKDIKWTDADHGPRAMKLFRNQLFEYVQSYLAKGDSALIQYNDQKKAVSLSSEFQGILKGFPHLQERTPEFYEYLHDSKNKPLQNAESFLYWAKETLKLRPLITVTHVTMYKVSAGEAVFVSKQIYANHYLTGSLSLTGLLSDHNDLEKPGFYLFYMNRSRTDMLTGLLAGLKRSVAKSKSEGALQKNVMLIKQRLEAKQPK